jgi:hypothetical protein
MATIISGTITAQNTFTDSARLEGYFNLSISGTINTGTTVTVQRNTDNGATWYDVDTFTGATEDYGFEPELMYYRIGIKSGEFGAGSSVVVRIGREDEDRH